MADVQPFYVSFSTRNAGRSFFSPMLLSASHGRCFFAAMKTRIPECCDLPDPVSCPTFSEFFSHDNVDFSLELYGDSLNCLHPKFYVSSPVKLSREAR